MQADIEMTDGKSKSRRRTKKCKRKLWMILSDFCDHASYDGIQYLTESGRHWIERVFWLIVVILSIYYGSVMVYDTWVNWQEFPVIVSFSEKSTPVSKIPFPAVTICPQQKSFYNLHNYTEVYHQLKMCANSSAACNVSESKQQEFFALTHLCDYEHLVDLLPELNSSMHFDVIEKLDFLAPWIKSSIIECKWANQTDCKELFTHTVTESGICFTFNSLDVNDMYREDNTFAKQNYANPNPTTEWSLETGYFEKSGPTSFPYRVFASGRKAGLYVALMTFERNMDYLCRGPVQGYNVQVHAPNELPQIARSHFRVPIDKEVFVAIHPNMMTTAPALESYSPESRQCFFNKERYLRFFKKYTQSNCEIECIANHTLHKCGCVRFSVPVTVGIPICTAADIECYMDAEDELQMLEFEQEFEYNHLNNDRQSCNCLPSCMSLSYSTDISQADQNYQKVFEAMKLNNKYFDMFRANLHISRMRVFFHHNQFHMSKRSELYGMTEFIANCGGLLGLFLGVSAVSVIEIFYFCTLRLLGRNVPQ